MGFPEIYQKSVHGIRIKKKRFHLGVYIERSKIYIFRVVKFWR